MLNFEERTGPHIPPAIAPTYPAPGVPDWFRDAKLGFFVHWGLYSVPAWADTHTEYVPTEDAYARHRYAEWYGNTVRIDGSPAKARHEALYGVGTSYEDLAGRWDASAFDADAFVSEIVGAGARYLVPTTKHHDGFCLWGTATTGFNTVERGPRRDLIAEFARAARAAGIRFGTYFSGALDWHTSDFAPIESDTDLFRSRRTDEAYARYAAAQLDELIERFEPDLIWNDIDWPDAGKGTDDFAVAALLRRYLARVPDGVVNDRWGVPYQGYLTREYSHVPDIIERPWEATRGLGYSFGFNQDEGPEESLSAASLVRLLVDVVSKNGNLLINVGPRADGSIPELQLDAMRGLGAWLGVNGEAIYATRPWLRAFETGAGGCSPLSFTAAGPTVFVHATEPSAGAIRVPSELDGCALRWVGADAVPARRVRAGESVPIPEYLRGSAVAVAAVTAFA